MARILYADDDVEWRGLMKRGLKRAGHIVDAVKNGAEALSVLNNDVGYDAVVTDGQMPEMDGLQLLDAIRASPAFKHLPVFVFTGRDDWEREVVKRGGMYLLKGHTEISAISKLIEQALA